MRIDLVSDLHLELLDDKKARVVVNRLFAKRTSSSSPLLILAGDIGNPTDESYVYALKCASKRYSQVVVILGNHEHYNHNYEETYDLACAACFELHNVTVLQNEHFEHDDGYVVLGTTLWTPIAPNEKDCIQRYLNDFNVIQNGWDTDKHEFEHAIAHRYLYTCLKHLQEARERDIVVICVTHHLPTYKLVHPEYMDSPIGSAFACSDMDEYIDCADVWICGHTHKAGFYKSSTNTILACNPVGYEHENPSYEMMTIDTKLHTVEFR